MGFILNFIFFIFFTLFIIVCITALYIYRSFNNLSNRLRGNGHQTSDYKQSGGQYGATPDDEVIIDRRTPDEANRKIFSDNEGEYVDFEEDK